MVLAAPGNRQTRNEDSEMSTTIANPSNKTEVAAWVMTYIDGARAKWVPTTPMLRASGIPNGASNVGRRILLAALHAMHDHGLLEKSGTGSMSWTIAEHVKANGWDTTNPFRTVCPKPVKETPTPAKFPFGPGRLMLTGDTYTHRDELKLQCGAKWDDEEKCWHIPDMPGEKVRLQTLECYKSDKVKIDWESSGYMVIPEPQPAPANRVGEHLNGHANGKSHAEPAGKDHTAELSELRQKIGKAAVEIIGLERAVKTEEDRSAKLAERLTAAEKMLAAQPKTIKVEKYDGKITTLKNVVLPENFDRILALAKCRRNILLVGPAGCGKSTIAKLVAQTLGLDFYKMGGSEGLTASHLLGKDRPLADKGNGKYEISDFVTGFEKGGVVCLDEMDAFDPNVFLVLNQALDRSGELPLPNRPGKPAKKSKNFVCLGTANTTGRGGNRMYVRNQLDASSLSRFQIGLVEVGYSPAVETAVCPNAELRETLWKVRGRMEEAGLRRIIDTRYLEDAYVMVEGGGWSVEEAVRQAMAGWSKDEMAKVGY